MGTALEDAADRVDESSGVQKKAREADLMQKVEVLRDGLDKAIAGDKQALSRVFGENGCERVGRLRLVVETVHLDVYRQDPRWLHLLGVCRTIELMLRESGTFRKWRPDSRESALSKRQMVRELAEAAKKQQVEASEDSADEEFSPSRGAQPRKLAAPPAMPNLLSGSNASKKPMPNAVPVLPAPALVSEPNATNASQGYKPPEPATKASQGYAATGRGQMPTAGPSRLEGSIDPTEEISNPSAMRADITGASLPNTRSHFTRPDSFLEGWVWKKSRFLGRWKRRWLVLGPNELASFEQRGSPKPTETVQKGSVLRAYGADEEVGQNRSVCIVQGSRNYFMVCDTEEGRRLWVAKIQEVLALA